MAPTAGVPCPNCCLSAGFWMIEEGGLAQPPDSLIGRGRVLRLIKINNPE
jgi:hypothetical protein